MRTVTYDLYKCGVKVTSTKNYAEALEWKEGGGNSFKARLDEVIPEVDPKEKEWRAQNIAKKDAKRKERLKAEAMERGARMAAAGLVRIN